jgi:hypothetical protein
MKHPPIFAFDFSMNKPAMCCLIENKINFYAWPLKVDKVTYEKLTSCDVIVIDRGLEPIKEKTLDESELILEHVSRSSNLAKIIVNTILDILKPYDYNIEDVIIANEGFAFAAKGDAALDLSGYKYILMKELIDNGFKKFKTYSPITIKSTAGCAKKGMGKDDMITALGNEDNDLHLFIHTIWGHNEILRKKTAYVQCVDDLTDAYWCLKTVVKKEKIDCILNEQN